MLLVLVAAISASTGIVAPVAASETADTTTEPSVELVGLEAPDRARVGDQVVVEATVRNRDGATRSETLEYRINGQFVAEASASLAPGETDTLRITATVPELGTGQYSQSVDVDPGSTASTTLHVESRNQEPATVAVTEFRGPLQVSAGEPISVGATVESADNGTDSKTLRYRIGDRVLDTRRTELDGDTTLSFEGTVPNLSAGTYRHGVFVEGRSVNRTASVRVGEAAFTVTAFWGPARGRPGEKTTVRATVTNTGTVAGNTEIQYRTEGRVVATRTVSLAPGQDATVSFTSALPDDAADHYRHGVFVGNETSGATATVAVEPRRSTSTSRVSTADGDGFTMASALLAVGLIGLLWRKKTT